MLNCYASILSEPLATPDLNCELFSFNTFRTLDNSNFELRSFYVQMIHNITGKQFNVITSKKIRKQNLLIMQYKFNVDLIKQFYDISTRKYNEYNSNYDYNLFKIFDIIKPNHFF